MTLWPLAPSNGSTPTRATASSLPMMAQPTCSRTSARSRVAGTATSRRIRRLSTKLSVGPRASRLRTSALLLAVSAGAVTLALIGVIEQFWVAVESKGCDQEDARNQQATWQGADGHPAHVRVRHHRSGRHALQAPAQRHQAPAHGPGLERRLSVLEDRAQCPHHRYGGEGDTGDGNESRRQADHVT